jgi:uncharacterized protein with FMN-binding domain
MLLLYSELRAVIIVRFFICFSAAALHSLMKNVSSVSKVFSPVLALAAFTVILAGCSSSNSTAQLPVDPVSSAPDTSMATSSTSDVAVVGKQYADGTYSATGNYRSPAGPESVEVSLTLANGVITDATFKGDATAPRSMQMQSQFAAGFKEQVVGKSIDSLSLTVVNGSSLTPRGFMDAVSKIKAQAQA